jgi:hypothetical protein
LNWENKKQKHSIIGKSKKRRKKFLTFYNKFKTFGAPIKSSQGRIHSKLYTEFGKCMTEDMKMAYIGENKIQYNEAPYLRDDGSVGLVTAEFDHDKNGEITGKIHYNREEDKSKDQQVPKDETKKIGIFEIPAIHRTEEDGYNYKIDLPSMAFEYQYTVHSIATIINTDTTSSTASVWNDGSYNGTTDWTEASTLNGTFVLNFGPCNYQNTTCTNFRQNPCYSYCPNHMNMWYNSFGWQSVEWIINSDGIAVAREDLSETIHQLSPEEILRRDKLSEERRKKQKEGDLKATELLKSWLSEAEWNYLQENNEIELPSQHEKDTIYIVKRHGIRNVTKKVNGVPTDEFCIYTGGMYANDDHVLSQILMIKAEEEKFLETAVRYPLIEKI